MSRVLYFDCFSGISGDMVLGALVDAGLPMARLKEALGSLAVDGYHVHAEKVLRAGVSATKFVVHEENGARGSGLVVMVVVVMMIMMAVIRVIVIITSGEPRAASSVFAHDELRGRHPGPQHLLGAHVIAIDGEAAEGLGQFDHRQPGIDERPEDHVAGDAREAVEVQEAAHSFPSSLKLQYRASPRMM